MNAKKKPKETYVRPEVLSENIYESLALGCAQCMNREIGTEMGFGEGNCNAGFGTY